MIFWWRPHHWCHQQLHPPCPYNSLPTQPTANIQIFGAPALCNFLLWKFHWNIYELRHCTVRQELFTSSRATLQPPTFCFAKCWTEVSPAEESTSSRGGGAPQLFLLYIAPSPFQWRPGAPKVGLLSSNEWDHSLSNSSAVLQQNLLQFTFSDSHLSFTARNCTFKVKYMANSNQ